MKKSAVITISLSLLAISLGACGGSSNNSEGAVDIDIETMTADYALTHSSAIDSLALNADDLTAQQAITVLEGYIYICDNAREKGNRKLALQTMRKYADVYDIVSGNLGSEFRKLVDRHYDRNGVDLAGKLAEYREALRDNDDSTAVENVYTPTEADTIKQATEEPDEATATSETDNDLFD